MLTPALHSLLSNWLRGFRHLECKLQILIETVSGFVCFATADEEGVCRDWRLAYTGCRWVLKSGMENAVCLLLAICMVWLLGGLIRRGYCIPWGGALTRVSSASPSKSPQELGVSAS